METPLSISRMIEGPYFSLESLHSNKTVVQVLDEFFKHIVFNRAFGKKLYHYQIAYINTSKEYVEFFGSNLLGTHVIRFKDSDIIRFFNEVLEIDYDNLESAIRRCDTINHTFKISGDIFNLTVMYIVHRCVGLKDVTDQDRYYLAHNAALIFFYRAIAAILSAYFTFPADPKVAQAAYANLSFKFLIKKLGSWHKVMDYRANELISKNGSQYNKLVKLSNDLDLVDIINDSANAIKDMVKNYYAEFVKVHSQGDRIGITYSTGLDLDGKEVVVDKIRNVDRSIATIKNYLTDQNAFIRDDYIRVIHDLNRNTSPRLLKETLLWVSGNLQGKEYKLINETVTKIIIYSFYLIDTRIEPSRTKDIAYVLIQLKNLYLSSRSTDNDLIEIRQLCDRILAKAHSDLSESLLLATRTAFILYITFIVLIGNRTNK